MLTLLSRFLFGLIESCVVDLRAQRHLVPLLSTFLLGLVQSCIVGLQVQEHMVQGDMVSLLFRCLLGPG
ncbi:hypothetical protein GH733_018858 [Mirounga leonina]|nr:hypothetical protein GH733_018858 [Mirounga leonina]